MRNPIKAAQERIETSVKTNVKTRVQDHFALYKPLYIACGATAVVTATLVSRAKAPVINVTVVNNLP